MAGPVNSGAARDPAPEVLRPPLDALLRQPGAYHEIGAVRFHQEARQSDAMGDNRIEQCAEIVYKPHIDLQEAANECAF